MTTTGLSLVNGHLAELVFQAVIKEGVLEDLKPEKKYDETGEAWVVSHKPTIVMPKRWLVVGKHQ